MNKTTRYSPEVRERAVRLVFERQGEHESQWAAIGSIASKIGCTPETLRKWVRRAERDQGLRAGMTTSDRERLKELERENRDLEREPTRFCARRQLILPRRSSTADRSDGVVRRRAPGRIRGRADLRAVADCPVDILRVQGPRGRSFPATAAGTT